MFLSIITPTYNEAKNVEPFILSIKKVFNKSYNYEIIFVDDNSGDRTYEIVKGLVKKYDNVRCLRRIGRRGLSSAVIEGCLSSSADLMLVMDADLQHDENKILHMINLQKKYNLDIVIGSRFKDTNYSAGLSKNRNVISKTANWLAKKISGVKLSDPMSGFFLVKRNFFEKIAHKLTGLGFKILLDIFSASNNNIKYKEIGFNFKSRRFGESKLDSLVFWEYLLLLWETKFGKIVPARFVSFCTIGGSGVIIHLVILYILTSLHFSFLYSQSIATLTAMTSNFFLNNVLTYRDRRKKGISAFKALILFYMTCGLGAVANVGIANSLYIGKINEVSFSWYISGIIGALVGAIWNFLMSSLITWRTK
mgnify:CR=1 FL=1|tara:strand:+ start:104 stop:1198 length:1095 start_codon:yes stop_codon:yes gene_type:complete